MARYRGPQSRISRRYGEPIFGPDKVLERKNYPAGQHGSNKRRGKQSEYGVQLQEKQKAKFTYGILEKQFSNLFKKASKSKMVTGEALLVFCESRLDNTVFRFGLSNTRSGARQLVSHKHITVNGYVVNIPSYTLKPGDIVSIREKSKSLECITDSLSRNSEMVDWLEWNPDKMSGKYLNYPERSQIPENIQEQLIVELYSK